MKSNGTLYNADDLKSVDVSRRKFLAASAVGVAGLGAVGSATAAPDEHTLVINGTGPTTSYSFTVGGNLEKARVNGVRADSYDEVIGQSGHGAVGSGADAYTFTGPLYSFDFDQSGEVDVELDGEAARVGQRPDHTLLIEGTGTTTSYSFGASQIIGKSDAYGSKNAEDNFNVYGAAGAVTGGKDAYSFNGDLHAFEFDEDGSVRVTIDGKAAHVGQLPNQAMILFAEREYWDAEYEVTVSGSIREMLSRVPGSERSIGEKTISGRVWGASFDKFTYDGEIESFTTNDPDELEAYSNYEKLY